MVRETTTSDAMPIPPDGYVAMAVAGAIIGEWLIPLSLLPQAAIMSPMSLVGLLLFCAGLVLEVASARALTAAGASTRPNGAATTLASGGVFRRSRNPFYLGILLLVGGILLAFSLDWAVLVLPLLWLALDRMVIPVEERRLQRAFGAEFEAYAAETRRWL